jgi:Tol biopolymer transport system component
MPTVLRILTILALICLSGILLLRPGVGLSQSNSNLIANGDFESGTLDPWITCGGAKLIDKNASGITPDMVHNGRYAVRIGSPTDDPNSCSTDSLGPTQVIAEDVTIPADASDVTISFWYWASGDWPPGEINLSLTRKPISYLGNVRLIDTIQMEELMPGWHFYRQNLGQKEMADLRGQTLYLTIQVRFAQKTEWQWAMHLDDMRIAPLREQTVAAPLPPELLGEGARPLVVTGPGLSGNSYALYRMDTDGGNRTKLADVAVGPPRYPAWSPDGTRIAYQTDWLEPEVNNDTKQFQALISRIYLLNADGSNQRPIFQSLGRAGRKDDPPGCIRANTCSDRGLEALDGFITDLHWSPNGQQIAATICARARWYNADKATQDASCYLTRHAIPAPGTMTTIGGEKFVDEAQGTSWSASNKLLFVAGPALTTRKKGLWELDLSTQPTQTTQLYTWLTPSGSAIDLRSNPDDTPTWSPDGQRFVVYRRNPSNHYAPINDLAGGLRVNYSIILYERANLAAPRHLLLVDHGTLVGRPAWSPDARFLLYIVTSDDNQSSDIWWLKIATGETGRLTNTGVNFSVDWLPTHRLAQPTATPSPQATVTSDPKLNQRVYLASMSAGSGPTATPKPSSTPGTGPTPTPIAFATLTPTTAPTAIPTTANPTAVPPRGISGRVLYKGAGIGGINVQLETCLLDSTCTLQLRTQTDATGLYAFPTAPSASGLLGYYVTYRNGSVGGNPDDPRYLRFWQSGQIADYDYGERVNGGTFDIAAIDLVTPDNAQLNVPATFTWQSRGVTGDQYRWIIQEDFFDSCSQQNAGDNTTFTFASLDCIFPSLRYNEPYHWYVRVTQSGENGGVGESMVRTVTFVP